MRYNKKKSIMVEHGTSLELPLEYQTDYLTPIDRFFVCNSGSSPEISQQDYRLRIRGDGIATERIFTYAELNQLEQRRVPAVLECAGNHRALFRDVDSKTIVTPPGTPELIWSTGAVGMAEWSGVPLARVLEKAALVGRNEKYGWVRFGFTWTATQGKQSLMTKAIDESGQTQPRAVPFNNAGYLNNAVHPHPVQVC